VIVCRPDSPFNTAEKLIEYAKKNTGKLTYASPGMGSLAFFVMELFKMSLNLDIAAVHYQGSAPTVTATLGGHTDLGCAGLSAYLPQIKAGKLVPLVVTGDKRLQALPNVPTLKEMGIDTLSVWNGLFAPPKTPKAAVDRIDREVAKIMKDAETLGKFEKGGILPFYRNSDTTFKLMETETVLITKVVKKLGMVNK
jgi:tripartite-type tricarboxylate transporter receptor subunit TctC